MSYLDDIIKSGTPIIVESNGTIIGPYLNILNFKGIGATVNYNILTGAHEVIVSVGDGYISSASLNALVAANIITLSDYSTLLPNSLHVSANGLSGGVVISNPSANVIDFSVPFGTTSTTYAVGNDSRFTSMNATTKTYVDGYFIDRIISTTSPLQGGGSLAGNLTLSLNAGGTANRVMVSNGTTVSWGQVSDGYISGVAWGKLSGVPSVNTTSPLAGGGALTSTLTLSVGNVNGTTAGVVPACSIANTVLNSNGSNTYWSAITDNQIASAAGINVTKLFGGGIANRIVGTTDGTNVSMLQIVDAMVSDNAAIAVKKLAGGSDGYYLSTSGTTPTWGPSPLINASAMQFSATAAPVQISQVAATGNVSPNAMVISAQASDQSGLVNQPGGDLWLISGMRSGGSNQGDGLVYIATGGYGNSPQSNAVIILTAGDGSVYPDAFSRLSSRADILQSNNPANGTNIVLARTPGFKVTEDGYWGIVTTTSTLEQVMTMPLPGDGTYHIAGQVIAKGGTNGAFDFRAGVKCVSAAVTGLGTINENHSDQTVTINISGGGTNAVAITWTPANTTSTTWICKARWIRNQ